MPHTVNIYMFHSKLKCLNNYARSSETNIIWNMLCSINIILMSRSKNREFRKVYTCFILNI